jgi:Dolichyl-phosphate-mannose-protein mannosyltransferase
MTRAAAHAKIRPDLRGGSPVGTLSEPASRAVLRRALYPISVPRLTAPPATAPGTLARLRARMAGCDAYDLAGAVLLAALVVLVFATYDSYAITNDEPLQQHYGELIVAYYASGFTDQALFHYENLYLYGGLFDVLAVLVQHMLPFFDPYDIRHVLCALSGVAGIAATFATARLVAGPRAGMIAAYALAACGPWYGSMFNHTKDIPFAAAMMGATYFLFRAARDLPRPRKRDVVGFGVLLGAALGMRVLGLLMVGYAGLAMIMRVQQLRAGPMRDRLSVFAQSAVALAPAFLIGYAIMIAAWPWSALAPLNPVRGLIDFGDLHYPIRTLFNGHVYTIDNVPRWYVPVYLLIKLPLLILAGAATALLFVLWPGRTMRGASDRRLETALLAFIALFPVICEVVDKGPAFTGLRHFLFVVPAFAILAGIGFDWLLSELAARGRVLAAGARLAIAAVLIWNAAILVELHPYQYLYYNPLVGGLEGAGRLYVTDYWVNIMPEAINDLEAYIAKLDETAPGRRYTVAVCGERLPFEREAGPRLQWTDDWNKADFFIAPTHMNCDRELNGKVIATISRLGAHIGVVKDRRALVVPEIAHRR